VVDPRAGARSVREADAAVEAAGRVDVQHPDRAVAIVAKAVPDARRNEDEGARARRDLAVVEGEGELALQDVERVVLGVVRMASSWRPATI